VLEFDNVVQGLVDDDRVIRVRRLPAIEVASGGADMAGDALFFGMAAPACQHGRAPFQAFDLEVLESHGDEPFGHSRFRVAIAGADAQDLRDGLAGLAQAFRDAVREVPIRMVVTQREDFRQQVLVRPVVENRRQIVDIDHVVEVILFGCEPSLVAAKAVPATARNVFQSDRAKQGNGELQGAGLFGFHPGIISRCSVQPSA
jgi:hypothetical protein